MDPPFGKTKPIDFVLRDAYCEKRICRTKPIYTFGWIPGFSPATRGRKNEPNLVILTRRHDGKGGDGTRGDARDTIGPAGNR